MKLKIQNASKDVVMTSKFKKSLDKVYKQGKDLNKLLDVIVRITEGALTDLKYHNHKLVKDNYYINCYECHIEPDWLLIYRLEQDELILVCVDTGSHSSLFKM